MASRQLVATVLFDLDGTLVDSAPGIVASLQHAFSACGITPPAGNLTCLIGPPLPKMLAGALPGLTSNQRDALIAAYRAHYASIGLFKTTPFPGIRETLGAIAAAGRRIYVVTNKPQQPAEAIMAYLELDAHVHRIVGGDPSGGISKPERAAALAQEEHLDDSLFLGDGLDDLYAAQRIGAHFLLAGWGYGAARVLAERPGIDICREPKAVLEAIRDI
jgi:phosphoglycolate phosphatase